MYDAIVVGARCAGASAALLLARRGLSVLLLERGDFGGETLCTHWLSPPAVALLERWDCSAGWLTAGARLPVQSPSPSATGSSGSSSRAGA